ncbi:MAG TPA: DUF6504 family protein [Dehalococcoidia bacterium]|nr:DUF6504 family protein [Dehalococcoidia bacterium]
MPVEFIRKEVSVTLGEGDDRLPEKFRLGDREYQVTEVLAVWQDHGYSGLPQTGRGPGRTGWQGGFQRRFYRLRTAEGETFEIYAETPTGRRGRAQKARWFVDRRITAAAPPAPKEPAAPPEPPPEAPQAE